MKRKLIFLCLLINLLSVAKASVSVNVYETDGVTPFDSRDIMVGSELTIVITGDTTDYWGGGLFIAGQDRALATLAARDFNPGTRDWQGSHYKDAGDNAKVTSWSDSEIWGFDLYGSDCNSVPNKWFIVDYKAIGEGDPNIWFYDYNRSFEDPNSLIFFSHVPSRDFNDDGVVNIADHSVLASYWSVENCNEPNWCDNTDINTDGYVDFGDLALFADYWLWGVPQTPVIVEDPNVTFSIVDENGLSDITIEVGQSITLYVDMVTEGEEVQVFNLEVDISDTSLGSIDNRPFDPDNPPGPGTARILANPRNSFFDDWGPGQKQEEGIQFAGVSLGSAISDGHLASFVFTCDGQGDVTLNLLNWMSTYARLEAMTIHQIAPYSMPMMLDGMSTMMESTPSQTTQELTVDEIVSMLEDIWLTDDGTQEVISEEDWQKFINSIKEEGQLLN